MKNKLRKERGITLIALIITIIILVILAAVSIRAAYNSGIIDYSINGTKKYQEEEKKEESVLSETEVKLKSLINRIENSEEESEEEYEKDWIIAWVFNDEDEEWNGPYAKSQNVFNDFSEDMQSLELISSESVVENATIRGLLYDNETYYTLVFSGTGEMQKFTDNANDMFLRRFL